MSDDATIKVTVGAFTVTVRADSPAGQAIAAAALEALSESDGRGSYTVVSPHA
jgi:hypothetical protein